LTEQHVFYQNAKLRYKFIINISIADHEKTAHLSFNEVFFFPHIQMQGKFTYPLCITDPYLPSHQTT